MSKIEVNEIVNQSGDNDSGIDLTTNDQIGFKIANASKWTLNSSGNLFPASTSQGIVLGATSDTAANRLDDYEEGTWTPAISGLSLTISGATYTKIGNMVTAHIYTGSFNITNAGSGYAKISGLPYASMYSAADYGSAIFYHANCFAESSVSGYVSASADFTISTPTDQDFVGAVGWRVANTVYLMVQVQYMTPN